MAQLVQKMWIRGVGVNGPPSTVIAEKLSFDAGTPTYLQLDCVTFKTHASTAPSDFWGSGQNPCGRFILVRIDTETG
jgi:hypothetical protein